MLTVARPLEQRMGAGGRMYGMSKTTLGFLFLFAFGLFAFAALMCASAAGQSANYRVIHNFSGYPNHTAHTIGPVIFDKAGNMYGVGITGGAYDDGAAYELSPDGHGNWTETILYDFCQNFDGLSCLDGESPSAGLAIDASGNLYGTTGFGGTGNELGSGGGIAFELSPPVQRGGAWTETVLYNFCSDFANDTCLDGGPDVKSQMVLDRAGNLYGTTAEGGGGYGSFSGGGVAFELSPGTGGWAETIIYNFCSVLHNNLCLDGQGPIGGVTFDKSGSLFGTTSSTGNGNAETGGTLYQLRKSGSGWVFRLLATVPPAHQPSIPEAPVSFDSDGNLYSTLSSVYGGVFQRNAKTGKVRVFAFDKGDGFEPLGGVYVDANTGAIYGTNSDGGVGPGNVFEIDPNGGITILHSFCNGSTGPNCTDGDQPWATLVPDASGNLYGTTQFGGTANLGIIFEIKP